MRREGTRQTFKLRLLAFVLALVLVWYAINPAPGSISRDKPEGELPDEKRRDLEPQRQRCGLETQFLRADALPGTFGMVERGMAASAAADEDIDYFEWPEFIDG